jgi:hypothetical protein
LYCGTSPVVAHTICAVSDRSTDGLDIDAPLPDDEVEPVDGRDAAVARMLQQPSLRVDELPESLDVTDMSYTDEVCANV